MVTILAPASQHRINTLPDVLQDEIGQRFEALVGQPDRAEWQEADKQLQLVNVLAASPFSAQLFLLNPHLLDHAFLTAAFAKHQVQVLLAEAMTEVSSEKQLHQCLRTFRKAWHY